MCKKILAFLLAAAMTFGTAAFLPEGTFSFGTGITASADTYGDFEVEWDDEREGYSIIGYNGDGGEVVIPSEIDGKTVTSVGDNAFSNQDKITSVTVPDSVSRIGFRSFNGCTALTSVVIPDSVTKIDNQAFCDCSSLADITIPSSVTSIGYNAFSGTKWIENKFKQDPLVVVNGILIKASEDIKNAVIPEGVTIIGNGAFEDRQQLESVTIPESVTNIAMNAFYHCPSLKSVNIPATVASIGSYAFGYLWNEEKFNNEKIPGFKIYCRSGTAGYHYAQGNGFDCEVEYEKYGDLSYMSDDDEIVIVGYSGEGGNVTIPSSINEKRVTRIAANAFKDNLAITGVTIPDSVWRIGENAFNGCTNLENITIPTNVTSLYGNSFEGTKWLAEKRKADPLVVVNGKLIDTKTASGEITIPNSITTVVPYAFSNNSGITGVTIPATLSCIERYAFSGCSNLTSVVIADGFTSISDHAFYNCQSLKSVTVPMSVDFIGSYAFGFYWDDENGEDKKVEGFKLYCVRNTPAEEYAQDNGLDYEASKNPNDPEEFGDLLYKDLADGTVEIVRYKGTDSAVVIPQTINEKNVSRIAANAFEWNTDIVSVTISEGVAYIGTSAFYNCYNLAQVSIPSTVTFIGDGAFNDTSWLNELRETSQDHLVIVNNILVDANAYEGSDLVIPSSVKSICWGAFRENNSIKSITIPDGMKKIDDGAFAGSNATSITIPKGVTEIGNSAFVNCYDLSGITIPDTVTKIGESAFSNCGAINSITIPDSVESIGAKAFYNCRSLRNVSIPDSVKSIGNKAFGYYEFNDEWESYDCKVDDFIIYCNKNTAARQYAIDNYIQYASEHEFYYYENGDGTITVSGYQGKGGDIAIPSEIDGKTVTSVGDNAFSNQDKITSVTVPDTVKSIQEFAFSYCLGIKSINISKSVAEISCNAFKGCSNLESITIDSDNPNYCSQDGLLFNKDKTEIVFSLPSVQSITIPGTVKRIGNCAFENCFKLTSVVMQNGVTEIGYNAFGSCENLTSVTISDSVKNIREWAFGYCKKLTDIVLPKGLEIIGFCAFYECTELKNITIPKNVSYIGEEAFKDTKWLEEQRNKDPLVIVNNLVVDGQTCSGEVIIPTGINNICPYAFQNAVNVTSVILPNTIPVIGENVFSGSGIRSIVIPDCVTNIGTYAFSNCTELTSVTISKHIDYISTGAFFNCPKLKSVTIPASARVIDSRAFGYTDVWNDETCENEKIDGFKIYCSKGTAGEQYAVDNGFDHECIELTHVEAKQATCVAYGNIEFWRYGGKCYSDPELTNEITEEKQESAQTAMLRKREMLTLSATTTLKQS